MKIKRIVITVLGIVFVLLGFYLLYAYPQASKALFTTSYISIGIGCGLFGHGIGELYQEAVYKKYPDIKKHMNIET